MKLQIKWSGNKYEVDADLSQPGLILKTQVFSLTGVPPERQKIMVKGGMLKDDADLTKLNLKENQQIMMMGTAGEIPQMPKEKTLFLEDMTDAQISKALDLPAGIVNLGNTCYLNSTIQCLSAVPELSTAIEKSNLEVSGNPNSNFTISINSLFQELRKGESVQPFMFIQLLRTLYPQFAERDRNGFMQQDAEECWGQIISALALNVKGLSWTNESASTKNFIEQFMTVELLAETKCDDAPQEAPSINLETAEKIRVNIGAGVSTYMVSEITNGLVEKIEKNSPTTGSMAVYTKTSKISRLPKYLTFNFIRFQWKPQERIKAKILKRVQFPFELDMIPFCTPDYQQKLVPARDRLKEISDKKAEEKKKRKAENVAEPEMEIDPVTANQQDLLKNLGVDEALVNDPGCNPSGQYDLIAVLTHNGRGANSGHYIGWVKKKNVWWKFDDDKVSQVKPEDISKLEGGGDWHTAYMCLYRSRDLE